MRFGTLVHAILSRVALDADAAAIAEAARFFARVLGADDAEVVAACEAAAAALRAPLMKAAAAAGPELRRECALVLRLQDGATKTAAHGRRRQSKVSWIWPSPSASPAAERWVVVDFKTDADIAGRLDEYRMQLLLYLRAISQSTGAPARGVLMWV